MLIEHIVTPDPISATLGVTSVSRITDLWRPGREELANLDKRSTRKFWSCGTCINLNELKLTTRARTKSKYQESKGSLA